MGLPVLRRGREANQAPTSWRTPERPWTPWTEFSELYDQMGRLLSDIWGDVDQADGWWRPAADVEETAEAYLVELELPGVKRDDVSVELGSREVMVTGEVKERERVGFLRSRTRRVGRFDYRLSLPADIEEGQVSASLSNGILTVRVPKTAKAQRRKIPIDN